MMTSLFSTTASGDCEVSISSDIGERVSGGSKHVSCPKIWGSTCTPSIPDSSTPEGATSGLAGELKNKINH